MSLRNWTTKRNLTTPKILTTRKNDLMLLNIIDTDHYHTKMKKIFLLAASAFVLTACDNNDNPDISSDAAIITATIRESATTRASDDKWAPNDAIGITGIVGDVTRPYINLKYTTEEGTTEESHVKFTGTPIFFYKPLTLTAYYPFTGNEGTAPGTDGIIKNIRTIQDNQSAANQPKIDFLWDSKTGVKTEGKEADFSVSNPNVNFTFAHKMSKLSFTFLSSEPVYKDDEKTIKISDGVDVNKMISYKIEGLGVDGTFDTNTGVCALVENADRDGLEINFEMETEKMEKRTFDPLIVFPQTNENGYTLKITTNELNDPNNLQHYKCSLTFDGKEIVAGCHYNFTIKVTKVGLIVGDLKIETWTTSEKFITATIDGDPGFIANPD